MAIKKRKKGGVRWVGPAKLVAEAQFGSDTAGGDYPGGGGYHQAQPQHKPYKVVSSKKAAPPKKGNGKKKPVKAQPSTSAVVKKA